MRNQRAVLDYNFHRKRCQRMTRALMVGNNEYNNVNTFPTRKVE